MDAERGGDTPRGAGVVIPSLDGLRAVAAILVLLTHAAFLTGFGATAGLVGRLWSRGDFGVGIFFALSGFLLHRGLIVRGERHVDVAGYALRRAARVLPAYWVALVAVVVFADPPLRSWLLHAAGLQIYVGDAWISSFNHTWSLATEISFYVALPFVVLGLGPLRRRNPALPLLVLTSLAVLLTLASFLRGGEVFGVDVISHMWLHARGPQFLVGMICAEALVLPTHRLSEVLRNWGSDTVACLSLAGAAYLLATTAVTGPLTVAPATGAELFVRSVLCTLVSLCLLLPLTNGRPSAYSAALSTPSIRWLGRVSYGVFLWHLPVFTAIYAVTGVATFTGGVAPLLAVGVPITLALAALSHHAVETPASRLVSRLTAYERDRRRRQDEKPHAPLER